MILIQNPTWVSSFNTPPMAHLIIMAMAPSKILFFFLFFLLPLFSTGTLVGFSYHAKQNAAASLPSETVSFLKLNKVSPAQIRVFAADKRVLSSLSKTGVSVDLYLNKTQVLSLANSNSCDASWLDTHVSIVVSASTMQRQDHVLPMLLSALKSIHSCLVSFHVDHNVKVSVALSLPLLKNLTTAHGKDLNRVCNYIKKAGSSIIVEDSIEGELSMGDEFAEAMIERARLAVSVLSGTDVPILMTITSPAVPSPTEVAELSNKVLKHLKNNTEISGQVAGLYAEVSVIDDLARKKLEWEKEEIFPSSHRELVDKIDFKTISHDVMNSPNTIFPTTPISTTPITIPPDTPIVTVPATIPVTVTPTNPTSTPVPLPSTTPITVPSTDSSVPVTNPVTTPPVTNPVTTYPAPSANVPVTTPSGSGSGSGSGQSWCVAKSGASESSVQAALDYACGIGGADCAPIQQTGSCYNPNTLQNHASYAFNSYYQKNPSPTSCDFGGAATIVNANPSTGSCIFPSSSSSSSTSSSPTTSSATPSPQILTPPATPVTTPPVTPITTPVTTPITAPVTTPTPFTTPTPTPTTSSSSGTGVAGSGTPPMVLNSSDPNSIGTPTVFGSEVPPSVNTSTTSISAARLQPFIACIFLVTSFVTQRIVQEM